MRESAEIASGLNRKMANPTEQRADFDKELSDIRREVIESRNLVIKTDNLLKNLHAEVKLVGKRQEDFQKRQWMSSAAAYFAFAVMAITATLLISAARTSSAARDKERLEKAIAEVTAQVDKDRSELQASQAASHRAAEAYRQMTTLSGDDRLRGIEALAKLDMSRISPLEKQALTDRAELLRKEIGQTSLERGKSAFRKNDMKGAIAELTRFMAMNPPPQDALDASYYLGVAYNLSKRYEDSVPALARFVSEDKKAKSRDYAMLLLSHSYEQTGQLEKAAEVAREALATYPNSDFANQLRTRLGVVHRMMGGGPAETAGSAPADGKPPARAPAEDAARGPGKPAAAATGR
jgi:tetratricopeptide (TPR) repeat protein